MGPYSKDSTEAAPPIQHRYRTFTTLIFCRRRNDDRMPSGRQRVVKFADVDLRPAIIIRRDDVDPVGTEREEEQGGYRGSAHCDSGSRVAARRTHNDGSTALKMMLSSRSSASISSTPPLSCIGRGCNRSRISEILRADQEPDKGK